MKKHNKLIGIMLGMVIFSSLLTGCDNESMHDFDFNGADFTCVENPVGSSYMLYVHEQTGVLYIHQTNGGFCSLVKSDGTPYTLEDYTEDCSSAIKFRERDK